MTSRKNARILDYLAKKKNCRCRSVFPGFPSAPLVSIPLTHQSITTSVPFCHTLRSAAPAPAGGGKEMAMEVEYEEFASTSTSKHHGWKLEVSRQHKERREMEALEEGGGRRHKQKEKNKRIPHPPYVRVLLFFSFSTIFPSTTTPTYDSHHSPRAVLSSCAFPASFE